MCANTLFLDHVNAKSLICRVNDWPRGFSDGLSKLVINHLEILIRSKRVREFWAVSKPLAKWVVDLNAHANVIYIPNGVSENIRAADNRCSRMHKSAIFVGGNTPWIDFKLVYETAKILSDWQFHFYHPGSPKHSPSNRNIKFMGAILDGDLPDLLNKYEVGLIPYRDTDGRFLYVERPLKFYQYVAAGLGVACTDIGSLRSGMAEHASFGNDPISFSQAILNEQKRATSRPVDQILKFLFLNSWAQRCEEIHERIIKLTQTSQ